MKRTITILNCWLILLAPKSALSQKTFISFGPELALPGSYEQSNNNRGTGFGGSLRVESSLGQHISGIATIGYISFAEASPYSGNLSFTNKVSAIPFQLGIKYYTSAKKEITMGFYISGQLGFMSTMTHLNYSDGTTQNHNEFNPSCAVGVGYLFKNMDLGAALQYNLGATGYHIYYYDFRVAWAFLRGINSKP